MTEKDCQNLADEPAKLHFDFWLNDIEAESLFKAVNREVTECLVSLMELHAKKLPVAYPGATEKGFEAYKVWYEERIEFLKRLSSKLLHERVEIQPEDLSSEAKSRIHRMAQEVRESGEGIYYPNGPPTVDKEEEVLKEFSPEMKGLLRTAADHRRKTGERTHIHGPPVLDDPRAAVEEQLEEDSDALFADGFDRAILGLGQQFTKEPVVAYDWDKCVEILMKQGMSPEEAVEYMDFNVTGAWVGERTPIFVRRVR